MGPAVSWFTDPSRWDTMIASSGPDEWRHVTTSEWRDASTGDAAAAPAPPRTGDTPISTLEGDTERIHFTIDEARAPVVVTEQYLTTKQANRAPDVSPTAPQ